MPTLSLDPTMFDASPRELFAVGDLRVTAFRFATGVAALRIDNGVGHVVVLPFVGQNALGNVRFYQPGESLVVGYLHGAEPA